MKRFSLIFVLLTLVVSSFLIVPVRSDEVSDFTLVEAYWGTDQPIEVSPGDVATLTVVLRYESSYTFQNLKANLSLPEGFEAVGGEGDVSIQYTGVISSGSLATLMFPIFITLDAEKGNYTADLDLEYFVSWGTVPKDELEISFEVTGKPSISVVALADGFYEGKQRVLIELSNDGDAVAKKLEIASVSSSGASAELESEKLLGDLDPEEKVTVPLSLIVPTGMKGRILPLSLELSYLGSKNVVYHSSETLQLFIKPSSPPPLEVSLTPKELSIGKSSVMHIDLKNSGGHNLSDIKIVLSADNILKIFGPTIMYIGELGPEESKRIQTEVYVPSTTVAPTSSLNVGTTYIDEDSLLAQGESHSLSILLRGLIEISLTDVVVIPSMPRSGTPFSITVTVTNIGTSTAYAAYAIPSLEDLPLDVFGPKSTYIGNIETNFPTTFTINLQVENTTKREVALPVTLSYMDNLRSLKNVTFSIAFTVAPRNDSQSQTPPPSSPTGYLSIVVIAVLGVAATAVFVLWRKRRR